MQCPRCGFDIFTTNLLSDRESEVAHLVARGMTNKEIGDKLSISINTVKTHILNSMSKLELHNRTQLAAYIIKEGR